MDKGLTESEALKECQTIYNQVKVSGKTQNRPQKLVFKAFQKEMDHVDFESGVCTRKYKKHKK